MIYITGDCHSDFRRFSAEVFPEQKEMSKDDYVIICGDFGGIWHQEDSTKIKQENYWLDWLEEKPFTTLFVDGNHENFNRINSFPVEKWMGGKIQRIRNSIIHLMRGQIFQIENKLFFTFGGASSHDITDGILEPEDSDFKKKKTQLDKNPLAQYRINNINWWMSELPNEEEMEEGLENLQKAGFKVDYIITHSPYTSLLKKMSTGSSYKSDRLTDYLQEIKQKTEYKHWLFGHMHLNKTYDWERSSCLYEQIIRIL